MVILLRLGQKISDVSEISILKRKVLYKKVDFQKYRFSFLKYSKCSAFSDLDCSVLLKIAMTFVLHTLAPN